MSFCYDSASAPTVLFYFDPFTSIQTLILTFQNIIIIFLVLVKSSAS